MADNVRQRKRPDESNIPSSEDDRKQGINLDDDNRRSRTQPGIPLS